MATDKERMLRGDLYRDNDPELVAERLACRTLIARYNRSAPEADSERQEILGHLLGSCGADTVIMPPFRCDYGYPTTIGSNTFLNYDAVILDCAPVTIGDDVSIGPRAQILTPRHPMDDHELRRARWESAAAITIGDNAWLGGGVIVCAGVTIGENTVIGAGSVVTRDVPARVFAAGNPCRVIRDL
ncbi:sugar O-acetyltransferase [Nocardia sp. NPDC001965]